MRIFNIKVEVYDRYKSGGVRNFRNVKANSLYEVLFKLDKKLNIPGIAVFDPEDEEQKIMSDEELAMLVEEGNGLWDYYITITEGDKVWLGGDENSSDEELDENGINGLEAVGLEKDVMDEQEGRNYALNQRGHNLMVLLANLPISVITTLKTLQADPSFVGNQAITDTYLQDIQNGATPEELIAAKVIFKLEDNNPTENIMENKNKQADIAKLTKQIEEATGKKVVLQEAEKVSSTSVGDLTVEEIIPTDSAKVMEEYVSATLKELKSKIAELETIKFDVSPQARASAEDWKAKTENVQFSIKQLERISRFVNNTLTAKKFDKNILDKLIALTPEEDTASAGPLMSDPMPMDMSMPSMDPALDMGTPDLGVEPMMENALFEKKLNEATLAVGDIVTDINGDDEFQIKKVWSNKAAMLLDVKNKKALAEIEKLYTGYRPIDKRDDMAPWYWIKELEPTGVNTPYILPQSHVFK